MWTGARVEATRAVSGGRESDMRVSQPVAAAFHGTEVSMIVERRRPNSELRQTDRWGKKRVGGQSDNCRCGWTEDSTGGVGVGK